MKTQIRTTFLSLFVLVSGLLYSSPFLMAAAFEGEIVDINGSMGTITVNERDPSSGRFLGQKVLRVSQNAFTSGLPVLNQLHNGDRIGFDVIQNGEIQSLTVNPNQSNSTAIITAGRTPSPQASSVLVVSSRTLQGTNPALFKTTDASGNFSGTMSVSGPTANGNISTVSNTGVSENANLGNSAVGN